MTIPERNVADPRLIVDLANAFFGSCVLFTASDAGVFRRLGERDGLDAETLARDLSLSGRGMRALADACVAAGLLLKNGDRYSLTATARTFLTPGSPADLFRSNPLQPRCVRRLGPPAGIRTHRQTG